MILPRVVVVKFLTFIQSKIHSKVHEWLQLNHLRCSDIFIHFSSSQCVTCPVHIILLDLITPIILGEKCPHYAIFSFLLGSNILFRTLLSNIHNLYFSQITDMHNNSWNYTVWPSQEFPANCWATHEEGYDTPPVQADV